MRNHLQAGAAQAHRRKRRKAEEDEAEVADGTVRGDVLEVFVADGDERTEHHVEDKQCHHVGEPDFGRFGHQEHRDAQASVGAHLHHHAGGKHRDRGRCGRVAVGTPEVEREERTRYGESHEHEREGPHLEFHREGDLGELHDAPAVRTALEIEAEERCQNHRGAERERQGEFLSAVIALAAAVAGDHQVHA